ncbi:MAG: sterol-binding protein [Planctomycetota bacterium]|nr:MAG: sterol-binding protein [Planctomycetota bacterium]
MDITCKQILEALCKGFQADAAGDWKAIIQFSFAGDKGGDYYLEIGDGKCELHEGQAENPTATVKTQDQVWIDISLGKANPMTAFMTGKVSVGGHMGDIMKLQNRNIFKVSPPKD